MLLVDNSKYENTLLDWESRIFYALNSLQIVYTFSQWLALAGEFIT